MHTITLHIRFLFLLAIISPLLYSCGKNTSFLSVFPRNVTLITQDYWWAGEDGEHRIKTKLPATIGGVKYRYHYIILDEKADSLKKAESQLNRRKNDIIIVDPVLTLKMKSDFFKAVGKTHFFIFFNEIPGSFSSTNPYNKSVYIAFNSKNIYIEAGKICAELIEGGFSSFSGDPAYTVNKETKIGILYYPRSRRVMENLDSFKKGFINHGKGIENESKLIEAKINNLNNRQAAQHSLQDLKEKGAGLFILLTLDLTPYCLDILEKIGGIAVVENAENADIYKDVILFSIDRKPAEGIKEALKAFLNVKRKNSRVEVGSSITWGKFFKGEIDVR